MVWVSVAHNPADAITIQLTYRIRRTNIVTFFAIYFVIVRNQSRILGVVRIVGTDLRASGILAR